MNISVTFGLTIFLGYIYDHAAVMKKKILNFLFCKSDKISSQMIKTALRKKTLIKYSHDEDHVVTVKLFLITFV